MIIHISAGIHPPVECKVAVDLLYKSLLKEFGDIKLLNENGYENYKTCNGYSSITFSSDNEFFKDFDGTIQWVCKSPVRPNHKRKNWFIDVSKIDDVPIVVKDGDIEFETFRSGGKGGQHQNKTDSGVRATHIPTGIITECREERSQIQNKKRCIEKINIMLLEMEENNKAGQKHNIWSEGNKVTRGNPIRIYKGLDFKLEGK